MSPKPNMVVEARLKHSKFIMKLYNPRNVDADQEDKNNKVLLGIKSKYKSYYENFSETHAKFAWVEFTKGVYELQMGNYKKSAKQLEDSLTLYIKFYHCQHYHVAMVLTYLGYVYCYLDKKQVESVIMLQRAIAIYNSYNYHHIYPKALSYYCLGVAWACNGFYSNSTKCFTSALNQLKYIVGEKVDKFPRADFPYLIKMMRAYVNFVVNPKEGEKQANKIYEEFRHDLCTYHQHNYKRTYGYLTTILRNMSEQNEEGMLNNKYVFFKYIKVDRNIKEYINTILGRISNSKKTS